MASTFVVVYKITVQDISINTITENFLIIYESTLLSTSVVVFLNIFVTILSNSTPLIVNCTYSSSWLVLLL